MKIWITIVTAYRIYAEFVGKGPKVGNNKGQDHQRNNCVSCAEKIKTLYGINISEDDQTIHLPHILPQNNCSISQNILLPSLMKKIWIPHTVTQCPKQFVCQSKGGGKKRSHIGRPKAEEGPEGCMSGQAMSTTKKGCLSSV